MATLLVKAQTESSQQFMEHQRNNFVIYKKVHSVTPIICLLSTRSPVSVGSGFAFLRDTMHDNLLHLLVLKQQRGRYITTLHSYDSRCVTTIVRILLL
jgi:hypothetical protein